MDCKCGSTNVESKERTRKTCGPKVKPPGPKRYVTYGYHYTEHTCKD